ncbi:MAG: hypothetical protein LAQ30_15390, partial [Acidobacteriia bacterium]|nr:hypothetical protein [Terriglobia bacterium]
QAERAGRPGSQARPLCSDYRLILKAANRLRFHTATAPSSANTGGAAGSGGAPAMHGEPVRGNPSATSEMGPGIAVAPGFVRVTGRAKNRNSGGTPAMAPRVTFTRLVTYCG